GDLRTGPEDGGIGEGGGQSRGGDDPNSGNGRQPLAGLVLAMPGQQAPLEPMDLSGQGIELTSQHQQSGPDQIGKRRSFGLVQPFDEFGHSTRPLRGDQPKLGSVSADRVDQHGPLTHQQLAGSMQRQHALTLGALDRHEAHRRPGYRLADRFGVGSSVLLPTNIGLYIRGWHQPYIMSQRGEFPRPEVRRRTRLHADQARRKGRENFSTSARRSFFLITTA